jgi:MinD-like ATPase involved in chromosome partitioning or flagellar assembly
VDLPTYTNIWRIEKRLYKLYDFRLPAPLPITWIAVFAGITVPYVVFLVAIGLPFNHDLVWLYVLPPGLLTWLTTRPVIENKRLPELVSSQLRYLAEPKTWCRMAPFAEKDHITLSARVWHRHPSQARTKKAAKSRGPSRLGETARPGPARPPARVPAQPAAPAAARAQVAAPPAPARRARRQPASVPLPAGSAAAQPAAPMMPVPPAMPAMPMMPVPPAPPAMPVPPATPAMPVPPPAPPVPERAAAQAPVPQRATASPGARKTPSGRPWPGRAEPDAPVGEPPPPVAARPAWLIPSADRREDSRTLEVSHDPEPGPRDLGEPQPVSHDPPAWPPPTGTFPIPGAVPEATPFSEAGPFPEAGAFPEVSDLPEAGAFPEFEPGPDADPWAAPEAAVSPEPVPAPAPAAAAFPAPAHPAPAAPAPAAHRPARSMAARVAALFVDLDGDRPLPSVERALSGPGSGGDPSWHRRVKVVTGGQGPGQRDLQMLDRDRARLPLAGPRLIAVLGCTSGAGQSTIAAMTGLILAAVRDVPVAALDLNPGATSLAARIAPAASVTALLAGEVPDLPGRADPGARPPRGDWRAKSPRRPSAARLDVIADPPGPGGHVLDGDDYQWLASVLAARYLLTIIDPAPSRLARVLSVADQLVLVAPVNPEAATTLANTQQWLSAHGYGEVAARAVTVINGVRGRAGEDVLRAESAARGRCRAILRVPWDDELPVHPDGLSALSPQTRLAYTALAGVLVSALAAGREARVRGRSRGDHSD